MKSRLFRTLWLMVIPFAVICYVSLFLALFVRYGSVQESLVREHFLFFTPLFVLWGVSFFISGAFELVVLRDSRQVSFRLLRAVAISGLVSIVYFYLQPALVVTPRRILLLVLLWLFVLLLIWYSFIRDAIRAFVIEKVYLLSSVRESSELIALIREYSFLGYEFSGTLGSEMEIPKTHQVSASVIIPTDMELSHSELERLYRLRFSGIHVYEQNDFFEQIVRKVSLSSIDQRWFIRYLGMSRKPAYTFLKRVFDIMLGIIAFAIFGITFPLFALLVRFSSPGSIFFKQKKE